ncbi:HU family DNA-binding protein [Anaerobiospirillum sp. NML120448]|uniref:HU family DNA-binding protein n=1 Tax=Anaerobiospirillum sp. NML120448 TaxID=2932816 RepID=UPI001FF1085A|nr:HU family DNA-binding protein [Anaerobiospirillum sp. NML120448]
MNKSDLVLKVSEKAELTQKEAAAAVNAFTAAVQEALSNGDNVTLIGFGTFLVRERAARSGHNPRTGEALQIPAVKVPSFRPGKNLKDVVNAK